MAGRIGSRKITISKENQDIADEWIKYIGSIYNDYKALYRSYNHNEDYLDQTILLCYEAIQRNGLKDHSEQGMKNYLFRAYNMNLKAFPKNAYDSRRLDVSSDDLKTHVENNSDETAEEKYQRQSFNDFAVLYLLEMVEQEFDIITYWCWRVKYLVPKTSFEKLKNITKVKDCKARVHKVNSWLRLHADKDEIKRAFNDLVNND